MFQNLVFTCLALNLESPLKESKMKYLLSILAFCLISICQSQNLILETTPKLIELKKNAVAANNYESAAKIKKEIDLRNKVDSIARATDLQIKNAVASENYNLASELKKKQELIAKFNTIPTKLKKALDEANFLEADEFTKERQRIGLFLTEGKPMQPEELPKENTTSTATKTDENNTTTPSSSATSKIAQKPMEYFCVAFNAAMIRWSDDISGPKAYRYPPMFGFSISTGTFIKNSKNLKLVVGLDVKGFSAVANEDIGFYSAGEKVATYVFSGFQIGLEYKLGNEKIQFYPGAMLDLGVSGTQTFLSSGNEVSIYKEEAYKRLNGQLTTAVIYKLPKFSLYSKFRLGVLNVEGKWNTNNQKTYISNLEIGAYIPVPAKKNTGK
jgi:hypothetical protein